MSVDFSSDRQLHSSLSKMRCVSVCTGQYDRCSPPQELIFLHKNGTPERNRNQIDCRPVSIVPARLCDWVSI